MSLSHFRNEKNKNDKRHISETGMNFRDHNKFPHEFQRTKTKLQYLSTNP